MTSQEKALKGKQVVTRKKTGNGSSIMKTPYGKYREMGVYKPDKKGEYVKKTV